MAKKLTAGIGYWDIRYTKATVGAGANLAGQKHIGNEIDVNFDWKHSDNVLLTLTMGKFMPGKVVEKAAFAASPNRHVTSANMAMLHTMVKF